MSTDTSSSTNLMPVLFLSHGGGPCFFMDTQDPPFGKINKFSPSAAFYRSLLSSPHFPQKPKAIVVISAHWEESTIAVAFQQSPKLLYDYYGFPEETYAPHLTFDAPTDLQLAEDIYQHLQEAGLKVQKVDRGFDHGVFIPLKLSIPEADIPIVQVSLHKSLDPETHIRLGEALSYLRQKEVLIIGSGQTTHNLGSSFVGRPDNWAIDFTEWLASTLTGINHENIQDTRTKLIRIMKDVPSAKTAHPREEHLIPIHVAFGAAFPASKDSEIGNEVKVQRLYSEYVGNMSLDSYIFL